MQCQLCRTEQACLSRAHIFPLGFFNAIPTKGRAETLNSTGERGRRLQSAIYDPTILCDTCEHTIMQPLDDYAIKVIRDRLGAVRIQPVPDNPTALWVFGNDMDKRMLRAFIASVLWRSSVSKQVELKGMSIGATYEERIRVDLLVQGPFTYVDILLFYLTDPMHCAFFLPSRMRLRVLDKGRDSQPANGWLVQFPWISITVSLDQRPHPHRMFYNLGPTIAGGTTPVMVSTSLSPEASTYRLLAIETDRQENHATRIRDMVRRAKMVAERTPG